ncbi:hypothetical protein MKX01_011394, partial [Papaver californicum]
MGCFSSKHHIIFILMFLSAYHDQIIAAQAHEPTPNFYQQYIPTNLNLLLSSLSITTFENNNTIPRFRYRNITIGRDPDTFYGSIHCREDIALDICSACVQPAAARVTQDSGCPNKKQYSDEYYFSILSQDPSINLLGGVNTIVNQTEFVDIVTGLLNDLVVEAVTNTSISPSLYATRSANYTRSTFDRVYAMVQCTPDLTPNLCNGCSRSAVRRLSTCCSKVAGARILFPSCTFRFENGPFYGNYMYATHASPPTLQSPSNTTNSNRTGSSKLVISIAIPLVLALPLSSIAVWWLCFHKGKKINNKYFAPDMDQDIQSAESLQFNFNMICDATNNFTEANKLEK